VRRHRTELEELQELNLCGSISDVSSHYPGALMEEQSPPKRARVGTMPAQLKERIEKALIESGEVEYNVRSHKKGPGPVRPRVLPAEDLMHDKIEELRQGKGNRIHYRCSNAKCEEPIRKDKWDTHILSATSDAHMPGPLPKGPWAPP
jgi:hypothetical protein